MRNKFIFFLVLILSLNAFDVLAQEAISPPKTINGGIINGKALELPKPEYPAAAKAVKASGAVNVQVTIDEQGNVISATAVFGHPLLRQVSEQAARQAKFSPTTLSGQPVRVTGVIVYNFVADKSNEERVKVLGLGSALFMLRSSASNLETLKEVFGPEGLLENIADDFPGFDKELEPLNSLQNASGEKRLEVIENVIASVQAKLNKTDIWQFELGKNFGGILAQMFQSVKENKIDFTKLDEPTLKSNLAKIKDLTDSAPASFPADVLEKFRQLADVENGKKITDPENLPKLWEKLVALLETISPDSTT